MRIDLSLKRMKLRTFLTFRSIDNTAGRIMEGFHQAIERLVKRSNLIISHP